MVITANAFQSILNDSKRKLNKIWAHKGNYFYDRSIRLWLENNDIELYPTHIEEKSFIIEKFIKILRVKFKNIYQKMCILINYMI